MLRVVVVDDEPPARRYLIRLLESYAEIQIVGEASSRRDASRVIAELAPDAIFMDIELGDGDGMDLWTTLPQPPLVVFVTAHSDRAARAFDIEALDYLLKPVTTARLGSAIERLRRAHELRQTLHRPGFEADSLPNLPVTPIGSVTVRSQGRTKLIKLQSISAVLAKGDYVELRMPSKQTELMYVTLTRLAERLPSPPFARLSRSLLVNLEHVAEISATDALSVLATFSTQAAPVELGRVAANRLRKIFA